MRLLNCLDKIFVIALLLVSCKKNEDPIPLPVHGTVSDIDGNIYQTIRIGNQVWMAENLKVKHYRNGDSIPVLNNDTTWRNCLFSHLGACCAYDSDTLNLKTYGRLYNWYSLSDIRNIAPSGWHIPSDAEWEVLSTELGGASIAGGAMKETGISHWLNPNTGATNQSGYTALPGGARRDSSGLVVDSYIHETAFFWSATSSGSASNVASYKAIDHSGTYLGGDTLAFKSFGLSVRCVKD